MPQQNFIQGMTGNETFEQWFNKTNDIIDFTNDNSGLVKIEMDYSGKLQPSVSGSNTFMQFTDPVQRVQGSGIGIEVGQPIFCIAMPTEDFVYNNGYDLVHCNFIGRATGITGAIFMSFTDWGDAWGGDGGGATDGTWQRNLFGLIAKIHSWDTTNKKIVMDICRPGGHFTVKYSDLNTFNNRNFKWYHENVLNGGDFFLGIPGELSDFGIYGKTSAPGGFFQITPFCGYSPTGKHIIDGCHYLNIVPYNDPDQHLRIYLDPRAKDHKLVYVSGLTAAIKYGSCEIIGFYETPTISANKLKNLAVPDNAVTGTVIETVGYNSAAIVKTKHTFQTTLFKITCLLSGQTYSRKENTGLYLTSAAPDDTTVIFEGSNMDSSPQTYGECNPLVIANNLSQGAIYIASCGTNTLMIINKMLVDQDIRVCATPIN